MKTKALFVLIVCALGVVLAGIALGAKGSIRQVARPRNETAPKPVVGSEETAKTVTTVNSHEDRKIIDSSSSEAAVTNTRLRNDLSWTFGGKSQRGWYLYDSLIRQTLRSESDVTSNNFAKTLSAWQKLTNLKPSGVFDEDSLNAMVSLWQNNRLKNRAYAEASQLVTAPPTDFYDPERVSDLRQVERNAYLAYKQMVAAAAADPTLHLAKTPSGELLSTEKYFKIISSFRSREYQEELRRKSPQAGSAGLAVNSPHFTGKALDIYVGGDPVDTKDSNRAIQVNSPAYKWLVRNADRFGFRPYFYEPWHWEYVR